MPVRVAVVGAGYLGQHHARVYAELPGVELAAVVDADAERAGEIADRFGSTAYISYKDVLDKADALSIAVPTVSHYEIALDCLRAGKDVLVEKPITATLEQAADLIREADERGRILQVGHLERFNPGIVALERLIDTPVFVEAIRVSPFLNRAVDVDVTLDLMIHDIDIVLSLVRSPITAMRAAGFSLVTDKIDDARAWLEFESGAVAVLTASRIAPEKQRKLRVFQKSSYLELDYQQAEIRSLRLPGNAADQLPPGAGDRRPDFGGPVAGITTETIRPEKVEPLRMELQDFIRCVAGRKRPKVSGTEAMEALKVALEINSLLR